MDAGELMSSLSSQLAGEDGLYGNCGTLAALFSAPQQDVVQATPDNSFAWSPCTYTLTTPEGAWPTSFSTVAPPSVSMERLPLATASGWCLSEGYRTYSPKSLTRRWQMMLYVSNECLEWDVAKTPVG